MSLGSLGVAPQILPEFGQVYHPLRPNEPQISYTQSHRFGKRHPLRQARGFALMEGSAALASMSEMACAKKVVGVPFSGEEHAAQCPLAIITAVLSVALGGCAGMMGSKTALDAIWIPEAPLDMAFAAKTRVSVDPRAVQERAANLIRGVLSFSPPSNPSTKLGW